MQVVIDIGWGIKSTYIVVEKNSLFWFGLWSVGNIRYKEFEFCCKMAQNHVLVSKLNCVLGY